MQIAIISDIQGNGFALEGVLQRIKAHAVDEIVCLGDLVTGAEPITVLNLLREHKVICLRGNMDEVILNPPPYSGSDEDERKFSAMDHWCNRLLSTEDKNYLRALPLTHSLEMGLFSGLCFHASPHSTEDVIDVLTPPEQLKALFRDSPQFILITGHMHQPMLRTFGEQIILNPGSVGLPYGAKRLMPTRVEYAIISVHNADLSISFHQAHYDPLIFKQRVLDSAMPHAEWYLSKWKI